MRRALGLTSLGAESLEDRNLLAILAPVPPGVNVIAEGVNLIVESLPDDVEDAIRNDPFVADLSTVLEANPNVIYAAFPQETNDLSITGNALNFFYFVDEGGDDIPVLRLPPAFTDDLIEDIEAGFSAIFEVTIPVGDLIGIDLPDVEGIVPNPLAITQFFPIFQGIADGITGFLDFTIIPEIGFPEIEFPRLAFPEVDLGLTTICDGGCTIIPSFTLIPEFTLIESVEVRDILPNEVVGVLEALADFFGKQDELTGGALAVLLDGNDTADFSMLTGVSQTIFAGAGADLIMPGGGNTPLEAFGIPSSAVQPPIFVDAGPGRDTVVVNRSYDVDRFKLRGGDGNDRLLIEGSDANDIIRLTAKSNGTLEKITFEAPDPGGTANTSSETQTITLPATTVGGDFTLTFRGATTSTISFDDTDETTTASNIESALEALSTINGDHVDVTGSIVSGAQTFEVTFKGNLANQDVPGLIADGTGLSLSGVDPTFAETRQGSSTIGVNEFQKITLPAGVQSGGFTLQTLGVTTAEIPFFASGSTVEDALVAAGVPVGDVNVSGPNGGPWTVEFTGNEEVTDQSDIVVDLFMNTGITPAVSQMTTAAAREYDLTLTTEATGGTFTLTYDGDTTVDLAHDATAAQIEDALEDLSSIGVGNVQVITDGANSFDIELTGTAANIGGSPSFTADSTDLTKDVTLSVMDDDVVPDGANQVQTIDLRGTTGGKFTLTFDNGSIARTTSELFYDATADEVETALAALTSVGGLTNVRVTSSTPQVWDVEFTSDFAGQSENLLHVDSTSLFSKAISGQVTVVDGATDTPGPAQDEVQTIEITNLDDAGTEGFFTLTFDGQTTAAISFDAPATGSGSVENALQALSNITDVTVTKPTSTSYEVTFEDPGEQNVADMTVNTSQLTTGFVTFSDSTVVDQEGVGTTTDELQVVTINHLASATGGTFTLSFDGETTAPIAFDASATDVENALNALGTINTATASAGVTVDDSSSLSSLLPHQFMVNFGQFDITPVLDADTSDLTSNAEETTAAVDGATSNFEQQTVSFSKTPTGGTFTLSFDGETTAPLAFNAGASQIEDALIALSTIGGVNGHVGLENVNVTGSIAGGLTVEFVGRLAQTNVNALTGDASDLVTSLDTAMADPSQSSAGVNEVQNILISQSLKSSDAGTFTLSFKGSITTPIDGDAAASAVESALEALSTIGTGNVSVTENATGDWDVEFQNELAAQNIALMGASGIQLHEDLTTTPTTLQNGAGTNELQTISLPSGVTGGDFTLDFDGGVTDPINYNDTPDQVESALEVASTISSGDVSLTLGANQQVLRSNGASFTFKVGNFGTETASIASNATADDVKTAIVNAESNIDNEDLEVTSPQDGVWNISFTETLPQNKRIDIFIESGNATVEKTRHEWVVEFTGNLESANQSLMTLDSSTLTVGGGDVLVAETTPGRNGQSVILSTTTFEEITSMELFQIEGGGGDDILVVEGPVDFLQGVFFDGGDGMDKMQFISADSTPMFDLPVFPDDVQGQITMDGKVFQFTDVEGGITIDGNGSSASLVLSGTDEGNEIRFSSGATDDAAVFSRDGQVTVSLENFGAGTSVQILGQQGGDEISIALDDTSNFSEVTVVGGGPAGADLLRIEGTGGADVISYTPGAFAHESSPTSADGTAQLVGTSTAVDIDFIGIAEVEIAGRGGSDTLTVHEPDIGLTDDIVLFDPEAGDDGAFLWTQNNSGALTVFSSVSFTSIETRTFDTDTGTDTFSISSDELPGVNSGAEVIGSNGSSVTEVSFGDEKTFFDHDFANDVITLEIGTVLDEVMVTPASGIEIVVNTGNGIDLLNYNAPIGTSTTTVDLEGSVISNSSVSDVLYTSVENVNVIGQDSGSSTDSGLEVLGTGLDDRFIYIPDAEKAGRFELEGVSPKVTFSDIGGTLTLKGDDSSTGDDEGDEVLVLGTSGADEFDINATLRTIGRIDNGTTLKALNLDATLESATILGLGNDDQFDVTALPASSTSSMHLVVVGGVGTDGLNVDGSSDSSSYRPGPTADEGRLVYSDTSANALLTVDFTGLEPIFDNVVAANLTVSGTNAANAISYLQSPVVGADGRVAVDGFEVIDFANKANLTINALGGDDAIFIDAAAALTTPVTVSGNASTSGDLVQIVGQLTSAMFTSINASSMEIDLDGAGGDEITLAGIETARVDTDGSGDISIVGTSGSDTLVHTPGAAIDAGTVQANSLLPLSYANLGLGSLTLNGSAGVDNVVVRGTNSDDDLNVAGTGNVTLTSIAGAHVDIATANVENVTLDGLDGDDTFGIAAGHGYSQINLLGGGPSGSDVLDLAGDGSGFVVDLAARSVTASGATIALSGVEDANLQGAGGGLTMNGTPNDDQILYRPTGADSGLVTPAGGATVFNFTGVTGQFLINGNAEAADEVIVEGTASGDVIEVDGANATVTVTDASNTPLKQIEWATDVEVITARGLGGDDVFFVTPGMDTQIHVEGGSPNASDRLEVEDVLVGAHAVRHHQGTDGRSGAITVSNLAPVGYEAIERVDILPIDPVTSTTGPNNDGRLVVFHADPFEQNDSRLNSTEIDDLAESVVKANIAPSVQTILSTNDLPGDEDWYRFIASETGTFRFDLLFDSIPELPSGGVLEIRAFKADGTLLAKTEELPGYDPMGTVPEDGDAAHTIGALAGQNIFLRVRGLQPSGDTGETGLSQSDAINNYDLTFVNLDQIGPQLEGMFFTNNPGFNLFEVKPAEQGPTPLVESITIEIVDFAERRDGANIPALNEEIAEAIGNYLLVGDQYGVIAVEDVEVTNHPIVLGEPASATIDLTFFEPLPDDRFTFTIFDQIADPTGNQLDGESDANQPKDNPTFPAGNSVPGGNFVARFTIDTRPEIGAFAQGTGYLDINGNFEFDPQGEDNDHTNRDLVFPFALRDDFIFAGKFRPAGELETGMGPPLFDQLGAFGTLGQQGSGAWRWLLDTDNDGVIDEDVVSNIQGNAIPVAGNFDGFEIATGTPIPLLQQHAGDEVALFGSGKWDFDTEGDNNVGGIKDVSISGDMRGDPIVGDFDGDGLDDLGTWKNGVFFFDLAHNGLTGDSELTIDFNFSGTKEVPVAADMNEDGIDDIGLFVTRRQGVTPEESGEWFFLISEASLASTGTVDALDHRYSPEPLGRDIFAQFGDELAVPIVGNFDPPLFTQPSLQLPSINGVGDSYQQTFDALGSDGARGSLLPPGWSTTFSGNLTTADFPGTSVSRDAVSAGAVGEVDRALAIGDDGTDGLQAIEFLFEISDQQAEGWRLQFDLEAWAFDPVIASTIGEAAFNVDVAVNTGEGYQSVADFGKVSTGALFQSGDPHAELVVLDGNSADYRASFDSGVVNTSIPSDATVRLRFDASNLDATAGYIFGVENFEFRTLATGDKNGDGAVDQSDLDMVLLNWGLDNSDVPWVAPTELVDQNDLDAVLLNWGTSVAANPDSPRQIAFANFDDARSDRQDDLSEPLSRQRASLKRIGFGEKMGRNNTALSSALSGRNALTARIR